MAGTAGFGDANIDSKNWRHTERRMPDGGILSLYFEKIKREVIMCNVFLTRINIDKTSGLKNFVPPNNNHH